MLRFMVSCIALAFLNVACWAQGGLSLATPPQGGVRPKNSAANTTSQPNSTDNGIQYHGGPVMNNPSGTNVYLIWYGDWSNNTEPPKVTDFVKHIGGTAYYNINTSYYDYDKNGEKDPVLNRVNYGGSTTDKYSLGTYLSDNNVANVVGFALGTKLPIDPNGVYFVLTSQDVSEESFAPIGPFCGWHSYGYLGTIPIKVAFIGDSDADPSFCQLQNPSPNNNPAADDAVNALAHELSETVTDPLYTGWWVSATGLEIGDLCERTFGTTKLLPNGSTYNVTFNRVPYLVQRLWVNARGGYCALALDE